MDKILRSLTRSRIYGTASLLAVFLILLMAFVDSWKDEIFYLFFNPLWPIVLGLLEPILQDNEKIEAKESQRKLDSLSGVIRRSLGNSEERDIIEAIVDAVGTDNLMSRNASILEETRLQEKIASASVQQVSPQDLTP